MTDAQTLRNELRSYGCLDIAASCGALQLLPQNAEHADRLVALAAAALADGADDAPSAGRERLAAWLIDGPSLHAGSPWDPYEGPFCEPLNFVGGGYLLLTGGDAEAVFHVRTLLQAMLASRMPLEPTAFNRSALELSRGVLALSTHACRIARTRRWSSAASGETVTIPAPAELGRLRSAVTFTAAELAAVTGVEPDALEPIVWDLDVSGAPVAAPEDTQFTARPLLRRGNRYVLVEPGSLAAAMRHALISLAVADGMRSDLVGWLGHTAVAQVAAAAERMDWQLQYRLPAPDAPIVSLIAGFDTDKAANVVILYEDLEGYDPDDPFTSWDARKWETALERHLRSVEDGLMLGPGTRPNELLHVVILAGCGRPSVFGLPAPAPPLEAPRLLMSVENLDRISMGEHDPLSLWKYARASERVRRGCHVVAFGPLDEFAAWSEQQSYYMGDDGRPTMILFDGSYGRSFREKVARATDVHGVVAPHGKWIEVVRLHHEEHIPIYANLNDLGGRPLLLVEGAPFPLWVRGPETYHVPAHRGPHVQIVDCVAYWLWQLTPALSSLSLATGGSRLVVDVVVAEPDAWIDNVITDAQGDVAQAERAANGVLLLKVSPALIRELDRPDNAGERALVRILLGGLNLMVDADSRIGAEKTAAALEEHAPLGPKKKINLLSADRDPALVPGDLPPHRRVARADSDELFDAAGEHIAEKSALEVGPIEGDMRVRILNDIVGFHFEQLTREVRALSSDGLLEYLIARHEAAVRHEAVERRTLGARMAAFGETGLIEDMKQSLPETTQAAIALRFLIEYVAAQPPSGLRPMSVGVLDRLLAICAMIVSRGLTSDIIHFGIENTELSFLGSGRLGLAEGSYQQGQRTFLEAVVPVHARAVGARYAEAWRQADADPPPEAQQLEDAALAEWGLTLTELLEFFQSLSMTAHDQTSSAASMPCADLEVKLATLLEWPIDRVRVAIALHVLEPRQSFTKAPTGFKNYETWPWRFNRSLSYLRRPLIRRPTAHGDEYVWGVRQPEQSGRLLFYLITSERLNARSNVMRQLMTRLRQQETQEFVDDVASHLRARGMAIDTNVKKVDGEKITRVNKEDLTDIDVLAADVANKIIYALECKDLEGARTPAELDNELTNTFRSGGTKRSAAEKQVERVSWLAARIPQTLRHLGVTGDAAGAAWSVVGAIVTDVHVLSPYVAACPLPVFARAEMDSLFEPRG